MLIERAWAMPNKRTFQIKPIKKLLDEELGKSFVDPFPYPYKQDALTYLKTFDSESVEKLVFDPPYSLRQLKEVYESKGIALTQHETQYYWYDLKTEIARIMKPNGKVISFGWNTIGIGKTRGFDIKRILLVCHGGSHNDTICTVETKRGVSLNPFKRGGVYFWKKKKTWKIVKEKNSTYLVSI